MSEIFSIPSGIASLSDYQTYAQDCLSEQNWAYISGGSADEISLASNRRELDNIKLRSRVLMAADEVESQVTLFGQSHSVPFLLAPVAYQRLAHDSGELATAQAAAAQQVAMVLSTLSSQPLEHVAACRNHSLQWFQLYVQSDWAVTEDLIRRAEHSGYTALVVTVDAPVNGLRNREQRAQFSLPDTVSAVNLNGYPNTTPLSLAELIARAPSWQTIERIRRCTRLPLIIKGILSEEDAKHAQTVGADGIVISNHGGRILDGAPSSIEVLADIRASVGNDFTLLFDSGVRRGSDIFKALALGADAVLIGRPQLYALAVAGPLGVAHMLRLLKDELLMTMVLCGCANIAAINPDCLYSSSR